MGDCCIRALSKALGQTWEQTYIRLCLYGYKLADMPSSNMVWGTYLRDMGFTREPTTKQCTVREFTRRHPTGIYVLALQGHVVSVADGCYFDTWDSGNEVVYYFWHRR